MHPFRSEIIGQTILLIFTLIFFIALNAEAHPPRTREKTAVISKIAPQTETLTLEQPPDSHQTEESGPNVIVWNSNTEFLCDEKVASVEALRPGTLVTIDYHKPFFGKPFATKVTWSSSGKKPK